MTHDTDIAVACTRLHGDILQYMLRAGLDESELVESLPELILERAEVHERALDTGSVLRDALVYLRREDTAIAYQPQEILRETDGRGFYAPQTLSMAYGVLRFLANDFETMVYEAVNLGGDTDSIASIVAATVMFGCGGEVELPEDAELLHDKPRLETVSRQLAAAALRTV
jgi:ADP-ribosylglycohydrolase